MLTRSLISAALALTILNGCGLSSRSNLSDTNNSNIRVYVGQVNAGLRTIAISTPEKLANAQFCLIQNDKCLTDQTFALNATPVTGSNGRTIYVNEKIPANLAGDFYFSAGNDNRRMTLGAGGASWKSIFIAGDYQDNGQELVAWDNARRDVAQLLYNRGFSASNSRHLNRKPSDDKQIYAAADLQHIESAFQDLKIRDQDSCFVFMTSHGTEESFYLEGARGITPTEFSRMLDTHCGQRPTVAVVSACYAGIMLSDAIKKDNRIIMTAADATHQSNGCQVGVTYTFFDDCLIRSLNSGVSTWKQLGDATQTCVANKENENNRSYPQFFYGAAVADMPINGSAPVAQPNINNNPTPNNTPNNGVVNIKDSQNLKVATSAGESDLRTLAANKRYLIIDFSASWCGYCKQFANQTYPKFAEKLNAQSSCKFMSIVDQGDLELWKGVANADIVAHTYALKGTQIANVIREFGPKTGLPNILQIDLATGEVNQTEGNDEPAFKQMVDNCK